MKFKNLFPISVACLASFLIGVSDWLPHANLVQRFGKVTVNACVLLWAMYDAKERNVKLGDWYGVFILITQPIGLIFWFIHQRKWRAYKPLIFFALIWFFIGILMHSGFIIGGMLSGYTFSALIEIFLN